MNVGLFVTSVSPVSPSQHRLQDAILGGLAKAAGGRYRFIVFSYDPSPVTMNGGFLHQPLAQYGRWEEMVRRRGTNFARILWQAWQFMGASGGRTWNRLSRLSKFEPKHYQQLRDLNIRLLWNMNQHELKVPIPFVRTVWEVNHRIHSMFPEYSYARYGFEGLDSGEVESLARASYVIVGTPQGKREVVDMLGVCPAKVHIIPFPAPVLPSHGSNTVRVPERYIFYPSRLWPHKNHVVILEALKLLRCDHGIDLACIFAGADQGNLAYVLDYATRLGLRDLIEYRGEVSEQELGALYRNAFALVYASAVGPDNLPPLEAMALGCPVIAAEVQGAREQYDDAALYFAPTDERSLACELLMMLRDDTIRPRQITRGKAHVAGLSAENYANGMINILDEFAAIARAWERCDSKFV
jgi:glycosyltransferase involved in cell wall biosynthesis